MIFLVDIIKPKPLPRNILNGNANHTNNNVTSSSVSTNPISQTATKATSITSAALNNENRSSIVSITSSTNVNHSLSTSPGKTESLVQRFSFSNSSNRKSPPEVLKRIAGKQIASIFEVRITLLTLSHTKHSHTSHYSFVCCFEIEYFLLALFLHPQYCPSSCSLPV